MRTETIRFEPRPGGQRLAWHDWRGANGSLHQVFLEGGWFAGKSYLGARKLLALVIANSRDAQGRATGLKGAMVGPTYGTMQDFMFPAFEEACEDWGVAYRWIGGKKTYVLPRLGCSVICRSAESADRITGWDACAAWGDEPARWREDRDNPRNDPLIQLQGRLRDKTGKARIIQAIYTYTNEGDQTRVYDEARRSGGGRALYRARTMDNPTAHAFAESNMASMTAELVDQYLEGGALSRGGSYAYALFDELRHVRAPQLLPVLPIDLMLDFNINPGMHALVGQYDPRLDFFNVVDELHGTRWDVRACLTEFVRRYLPNWSPLWGPLRIFGDASGKSGWEGTGESCYDIVAQILGGAGIRFELHVPAANPFVPDRVNAVALALLDVTNRKHMVVHPTCQRLIADFKNVRWDKRGKELEKKDARYTHASDALGYWVHRLRPCRRIVESVGQMSFGVDD